LILIDVSPTPFPFPSPTRFLIQTLYPNLLRLPHHASKPQEKDEFSAVNLLQRSASLRALSDFYHAILMMNVGEYSKLSGLQITSGTRRGGHVFPVSKARVSQMTFSFETRVQLNPFG
jgi:hypothetical protein